MRSPSYDHRGPLRLSRAIDLWVNELALRGKTRRTRDSYERLLMDFAKKIDPLNERPVDTLSVEDCRRFLDRWRDASPTTLATGVSILRGFVDFLDEQGELPQGNPMVTIRRPRRQKDPAVVKVSGEDVAKILFGCQDFQELICVGAAAYLGRRRAALANARRSDADLENGLIRFSEKGGKVIEQPMPDDYLAILREAEQHGVWDGPNDYLIPNRRKATTNQKRRSSKIVYETVLRVAERVGVRATVHALRRAFAVHFLESHPGKIESLKELMGHDRIETTELYLKELNRSKAMDDVRDLSWNTGLSKADKLEPSAVKAHTGFEPVLEAAPQPAPDSSTTDPLKAKLAELRAVERARAHG